MQLMQLLPTPAVSSLLAAASLRLQIEAEKQLDAYVARGVTEAMIHQMDSDGTGSVDRFEFLKSMLLQLGKVEEDDVAKIIKMFDDLDADGSGTLDIDDIRKANRPPPTQSKTPGTAGSLGSRGEAGLFMSPPGKDLAKPLLQP